MLRRSGKIATVQNGKGSTASRFPTSRLATQTVNVEQTNLHRIWNETLNRLETFRGRVQENRDVMAASEFARWLLFSGLIELFKVNAKDGFFKVDGCLIESKAETLLSMCNDRFRTNDQEPSFQKSEFESLREKIDRMAGYLAQLSVASAVTVNSLPSNIIQLTHDNSQNERDLSHGE